MINQRMLELGLEPSAIRQLYAYGLKRKAQVGEDNVYDFSLGNPSVPAPQGVRERIVELLADDPIRVHGYTMAAGLYDARKAVADNLAMRFGIKAQPEHVYMTVGATAALDITIAALSQPGDEIIVNAPYFPEYKIMIETSRCKCVEVMMTVPDFQLDIEALRRSITPKTSAVIINSPNNPVGCIYSEENIQALAALLVEMEQKYNRPIYLISDEPYREIFYDVPVPFTAHYYAHTIVCYSWAKSLSLPGERIGYVYVSDNIDNADEVMAAIAGAGRAFGFTCAPSLFQRVIQTCITLSPNVEAYRENRRLLTTGLDELGYQYVPPAGAFYLWVKALEDDAQAFSNQAKKHDLLIVPSNSFGVSGWVRCGYCVSSDTIKRSMRAWRLLKEDYAR